MSRRLLSAGIGTSLMELCFSGLPNKFYCAGDRLGPNALARVAGNPCLVTRFVPTATAKTTRNKWRCAGDQHDPFSGADITSNMALVPWFIAGPATECTTENHPVWSDRFKHCNRYLAHPLHPASWRCAAICDDLLCQNLSSHRSLQPSLRRRRPLLSPDEAAAP